MLACFLSDAVSVLLLFFSKFAAMILVDGKKNNEQGRSLFMGFGAKYVGLN